jgi:chromosomal replication initiation ATPase DnaA
VICYPEYKGGLLMAITKIEDMTIDTFPINDANRADYNVCKEMLKNPANFRLVFFNRPSNERMHLKHAILNYFEKSNMCKGVTISEFTNDLIAAILGGSRPYDLSKYLDPSILVVDDFQHIAGKDTTQEEFYILLKKRLETKKLTILLSEYNIAHLSVAMREELIHLLRTGVQEDN